MDRLSSAAAQRRARAAAKARPLFDSQEVWQEFEHDLLSRVHGQLLVVAPRLSPHDIERLRTWAAKTWGRVHALSVNPLASLDWPAHFDDLPGALEVREGDGDAPWWGSYAATEGAAWMFVGEIAHLGDERSFIHEITEPEPIRQRLLDAWRRSRPVRWNHRTTAVEDAAE